MGYLVGSTKKLPLRFRSSRGKKRGRRFFIFTRERERGGRREGINSHTRTRRLRHYRRVNERAGTGGHSSHTSGACFAAVSSSSSSKGKREKRPAEKKDGHRDGDARRGRHPPLARSPLVVLARLQALHGPLRGTPPEPRVASSSTPFSLFFFVALE